MKIQFKEAKKGGETNEIQPIMVDFQTYDQGEYQEEDNPGCAKGEQSNTKRSGTQLAMEFITPRRSSRLGRQ